MLKLLVVAALLVAVNCQPVPASDPASEESAVGDFFGKIKTGFSSGASKLKEGIEKGASKVASGAGKAYEKVKDTARDGLDYVKEKIHGTTQSPLDKFVSNVAGIPDSSDKNKRDGENFMYDIDVRSVPLAAPLAQPGA